MLFGRDTAVQQVDALVADVVEGRSRVLVVTGDPGIGKSALLAFAAQQAWETTDCVVLEVSGVRSESELPFAGLRSLLRPVLDARERIPERQSRALTAILGLDRDDPDEDVKADPSWAFAGVLSLLADRAERQPVLVLVDDAQWLDAASLKAISFAAGRLEAERVGIVVAQRSGTASPFTDGRFPELRLEPLDPAAARALAEARADGSLPERALARLLDTAAGNPLVVVALVARGDAPPAIESSLAERLFGKRISGLSAVARIAVTVAAAADDDGLDPLLEAARALGAGFEAWEEAEACDLLVLEPGRMRFQHPLARSAVQDQASPAERRAAHAAIADAFDAREEPARAAWHRAAAAVGADEGIAAALEAAAREYTRRSGHLGAALALERAARLSPLPRQRAQRLVAAAESARRAQHDDDADDWAAEALTLADDPRLRRRAELVRAGVEAWRGSLAASRRRYLEVARGARDDDPDTAAAALSYAAAVAVVGGDTAGALESAEEALAAAGATGSASATMAARETLASVLVLRGDLETARPLLDTVADAYENSADGSGAQYAALSFVWIEDYGRAGDLLEAAVADARSSGNLRDLAQALEIRADLGFRRGAWPAASADASESASFAEDTREPVQLAYSLATLAILEAARGDAEATRDHVAKARALAQTQGLRVLDEYAGFALGLLALGAGETARALEALEPVADYVATTGRGSAGILFWPADLIQAAIRGGREELARAELARLEEQATRTGLAWPQAVAARCRGLLASKESFDAEFVAAIAHHRRMATPFELARTQFAYGERLQRFGRRVDARAQLLSAIKTFEDLGALNWAKLASDQLDATGQRRRPSNDPTTVDELTPRELQIARAVAEGATNNDVAKDMFLSTKTIEGTLTRVYRKVGVRGKTELVAKLRELLEPPE